MQYIFFIYFFIGLLLTHILIISETFSYVQLSGYSVKSVFNNFCEKLKFDYLNIFLAIVIMIAMYLLNVECELYYVIYLLVEISLWLYCGNEFGYLKKIKYTKRMIRIIVMNLFLDIIVFLICTYLSIKYLTILFPLIYLIAFINLALVLVLLQPIEFLIGKYYISKAKNKLSESKGIIKIGITGSFGKTSTKEILKSILEKEYSVLSTPASYNTPLGICKTINNDLKTTHEIFICEMGAKKRGEIKYLCDLVRPDMALITAVGRQHTNTFGSVENVYRTKKELADSVKDKFCAFNLMNEHTYRMYNEFVGNKVGVFLIIHRNIKAHAKLKKVFVQKICKNIVSEHYYEFLKLNNVYAKNIALDKELTTFDIYSDRKFLCSVKSKLLGLHNIINILLATAMAVQLNVSAKTISSGIMSLENIHARLEKSTAKNGALIINNGYNSNIDSAKFSLAVLKIFDGYQKLVITPGLIECKDEYKYNFEFGKLLAKYADEIIIVKMTNRQAIVDGLKLAKFDMKKVFVVNNFKSAKGVVDKLDEKYVVLIENDLPDNFK